MTYILHIKLFQINREIVRNDLRRIVEPVTAITSNASLKWSDKGVQLTSNIYISQLLRRCFSRNDCWFIQVTNFIASRGYLQRIEDEV